MKTPQHTPPTFKSARILTPIFFGIIAVAIARPWINKLTDYIALGGPVETFHERRPDLVQHPKPNAPATVKKTNPPATTEKSTTIQESIFKKLSNEDVKSIQIIGFSMDYGSGEYGLAPSVDIKLRNNTRIPIRFIDFLIRADDGSSIRSFSCRADFFQMTTQNLQGRNEVIDVILPGETALVTVMVKTGSFDLTDRNMLDVAITNVEGILDVSKVPEITATKWRLKVAEQGAAANP